MANNDPVIILLSSQGETVAQRIKQRLPSAEIHALDGRAEGDVIFTRTGEHVQGLFRQGCPIIGLCASGILIRIVAPCLNDKWQEPPVIAVAEDGSAIVPLLGGHHGANDMAREIAEILERKSAITTSGDVHFGLALDQPPAGFTLANPDDAKPFMAQLLAGEKVFFPSEAAWLSESELPFSESGKLKITFTTRKLEGNTDHLVYHPRTMVLGIGSERGAPADEAIDLANSVLVESNISPLSIAAVTSIDLKSDEAAVHSVADHFRVPAGFFSAESLEREEPRLKTPSAIVRAEVGVAGVCEGAALCAAGADGHLLVPKRKSKKVTIAIAEASAPDRVCHGQSRGRVFLVGIGPGNHAWRSTEATKHLRKVTDWVGYDLYLDLVQDLKTGQVEHRFPLGEEEKRVRHALELAAEGKDVAVVCSGDPGIYAMATLAYELIDTGAAEGLVSAVARRVEIVVTPGISAFQAAAARVGAPIGHDFCCISLSDLLTPRDQIIKRLNAAAIGDFVVAFYNPRSKRRVTLLDEAFDILRAHRPVDTPVILATDLGRPAEHVRVRTLESVVSEEVDMLTLVMVGSSHSKAVNSGDGNTWVYTPRGYDRKGS